MATKNVKINNQNYNGVDKVKLPLSADTSTFAEFVETSDANAIASDIATGKTAYVNGQKLTGTYTPEVTLIEKNVTENGTYYATDDNANGYSQVVVNVPQGSTEPHNEIIRYYASKLEAKQVGDTATILGSYGPTSGPTITLTLDENLKTIPNNCYYNSGKIEFVSPNNFANVESIGEQAFRSCALLTADLTFPKVTALPLGVFMNSKITGIKCPKVTNLNAKNQFANVTTITKAEFGSVGFTVTTVAGHPTAVSNSSTIYTVGTNVDSFISSIRTGSPNATITIKASENTTYNGTSYSAGDTIKVDTPNA